MPVLVTTITFQLNVALDRRLADYIYRNRGSKAEFIRRALEDRLDYCEAKERADEDRRKQSIEATKREREERRKLKPHNIGSVVVNSDDYKSIYDEQAAKIVAVIDKPHERRLTILAAIEAVKKDAPLTHPSDEEIIKKLERAVVRVRISMPPEETSEKPAEVPDVNVGKPIDTNVPTFGFVPDSVENDD